MPVKNLALDCSAGFFPRDAVVGGGKRGQRRNLGGSQGLGQGADKEDIGGGPARPTSLSGWWCLRRSWISVTLSSDFRQKWGVLVYIGVD